ncbi:MAG: sulfate permease [Bacteroidota bacterium]
MELATAYCYCHCHCHSKNPYLCTLFTTTIPLTLLERIFPILASTKGYTSHLFRKDIVAGLTVGILLVPQGMAYALLAGMPPIYGLYSGLVPLLVYAIFGTSRQMSVGPVAVSSLLILGGISELATPETPQYIELAVLAGLLIGGLHFGLSLLRLGFLANFLSRPVISGFTSAAAIIIAASQLKDFLGIQIPRGLSTAGTFRYVLDNAGQINWISVGVCLGAILLMFGFRAISRSIPDALVVVILGVLLSYFADLQGFGLSIVGAVPRGLPSFQLPSFQFSDIEILGQTVLTVTLINIVECLGMAKSLEAKHQNYVVRPNQELLALGLSKIGGAFFQAMPTSASFTRSAINSESGAQTTVASLVTVLLIALTLLFLTPLFYYLPRAVLAAIILMAVKSLFDWKEAVFLWRTHREDFIMMLLTFIVTLVVSIPVGIFTGVLLSIGAILFHSSRPHFAVLGQMEQSNHYLNVQRFSKAKELPHTLIMRFDEQLYFANADYFKDAVRRITVRCQRPLQYFYLDASDIQKIDSSGLHALADVHRTLQQQNIQLCICSARGPVRDLLYKSGLMETIGWDNQFVSIHAAYLFHQSTAQQRPPSSGNAWQSNFKK